MSANILAALEEARDLVEESPVRALRRLPAANRLPRALRAERDFIAAEAWRARGYFGRAQPLYKRALRATSPTQDPTLWIEAAIGSASGLRSVGQNRAAAALLKRAGSLARKTKIHRPFAARLELESALVDRAAEKYGACLKVLRARLRKAKAARAFDEAAFLLWAVGGAERFQGKLRAAEESFSESLRLARLAGDPIGAGYALFGLGGAARVRGKLAQSESRYAKAGALFADTEDDFAKAYAFCGRANALRQLGRLDESRRSYEKSRRIYAKLGDPVDLAYVDWGLGEIALKSGRAAEALAPLKSAELGFAAGGESRGLVLAWLSTARALHALGQTARASALFTKAVTLARKKRIYTHLESYT